jgi:hypothetical protein
VAIRIAGEFVYARGHTLMGMASAQFGQAQTVGFDQPRTGFGGTLDKLTHAGIAAARLDIHLDDRLRCGPQTNTNRMKSEQYFGRRHVPIIGPAFEPGEP